VFSDLKDNCIFWNECIKINSLFQINQLVICLTSSKSVALRKKKKKETLVDARLSVFSKPPLLIFLATLLTTRGPEKQPPSSSLPNPSTPFSPSPYAVTEIHNAPSGAQQPFRYSQVSSCFFANLPLQLLNTAQVKRKANPHGQS
jgi:hypothetical protein